LGNYIGIDESAEEIFGKVMSVSDETMWTWYELLSFRSLEEIKKLRDDVANGMNPRDVKFLLAEEIAARFHDAAAGQKARENFIAQFQKGKLPEDMPEISLEVTAEGMSIINIIKNTGLTESTSEASRLVVQGGVRIDGEKVSDKNLHLKPKTTFILQVGKRRYAKVNLL